MFLPQRNGKFPRWQAYQTVLIQSLHIIHMYWKAALLSTKNNYVSTKKNKGSWGGSVGKTLALQARGPEFHSSNLCKCVWFVSQGGKDRIPGDPRVASIV